MAKGITIQEAAARLTESGMRLSDRYSRGAMGKGSKWQSGAAAAEGNYKQGIQEAMAAGKYGKGIARAGGGAYDQGVQNKGVINWPTGMQLGGDKYIKNGQKFATLWNQPLPTPHGARRSPNNLKRMQDNVDRFIKAAQ